MSERDVLTVLFTRGPYATKVHTLQPSGEVTTTPYPNARTFRVETIYDDGRGWGIRELAAQLDRLQHNSGPYLRAERCTVIRPSATA